MKFPVILFLVLLSCSVQAQIDTLWTRCYGGSADEAAGFGTGTGGAPTVHAATNNQGEFYIASYTASSDGMISNNAGVEDVFVIKLNENGDTLWTKTIGGSGFERSSHISVTQNGDILITGRSVSNDGHFLNLNMGSTDGFICRMSPSGEIIWIRTYGGDSFDQLYGAEEISGGDIITYGISGSIDGDINDATWVGSNKAWVMRLSSTGNRIWSRITNGFVNNPDWEEAFHWGIWLADNSGIVLQGASYNFNDLNTDDILICKYDGNGNQLFKKVYGSNAGDSPAGVVQGENGQLHFGNSIRGGGNFVNTYFAGNADIWVFTTNAAGDLIWEKNYGGSSLDYAYGLSISPQGTLFCAAATRSTDNTAIKPAGGLMDAFVIEINPMNGDTLQTIRFGGAQNEYAHTVLFTNNDLIVVGRTSSADNDYFNGTFGGVDLFAARLRDASVGIEAKEQINIQLYPNPADDVIFLRGDKIEAFTIVDMQGRRMLHQKTTEQFIQIPLKNLISGIYIVEVKTNETTIHRRFIKH